MIRWDHAAARGHAARDAETAARWERIAGRVARAHRRGGAGDDGGSLWLELTEALLIAHDLYMLGEIVEEPTLRWDTAAVEQALAPWAARVVPDGALTWNRQAGPAGASR